MMVSTVGVFEFEDEGALNAKQIDHNAPEDFDPAKHKNGLNYQDVTDRLAGETSAPRIFDLMLIH